ncbi:MAG: hypothetical protein WC144_02855 [Sulfurimonas sp.]|jgi:hypothetical protein|nr:hypothetical protein [Sulfurimonadaceae bacterium]
MRYILLTLIIFFGGCSVKNYENTAIKIVTIKSPKIKFNDIGYVRNTNSAIELELFIAAKAIDKITINHLICTTKDGCMGKSSFNSKYLHSSYPSDLLQDMLLAKAIYGGANVVKTANGFTQHISDEHVDITYEVRGRSSFFRDRKNSIIFNIKEENE